MCRYSLSSNLKLFSDTIGPQVYRLFAVGDPGSRPHKFLPKCDDSMQLHKVSKARAKHQLGSRTCLRALEALAFLSPKYAFSHFSWHLFFKIFNLKLWKHITKNIYYLNKVLVTVKQKFSDVLIILLNLFTYIFLSMWSGAYLMPQKLLHCGQGPGPTLGPWKLSHF